LDSPKLDVPSVLYAAAVVSVIAILVAAIPVGFYTVFYASLSNVYTYQTVIPGVPFYIGLLTIRLPFSPTFGATFAVLAAVCAIFIGLAAWQGGGLLRALKATPREGVRPLLRNPLSATVIILGASLFVTQLLDYLQTTAGIPTGGISGDPLELLISFNLAAFIEEIGYRFFLIGVPLFVVLLIFRSSVATSIKALWRPSAAWDAKPTSAEGRSLQESYKLLVYLLIAFSSLAFGLAHYLANSGWSVGKISEAALDGVALAYLYVRYGLHTSIIYHWATDYALNAFAFYAQAVYGVPWTANSVYSLVPAYDVLYLVGIPGSMYIAYRIIMWSVARRAPQPLPVPEAQRPMY
jgi:hypothetical protein